MKKDVDYIRSKFLKYFSGKLGFGENIKGEYDNNFTHLRIYGTGRMFNFSFEIERDYEDEELKRGYYETIRSTSPGGGSYSNRWSVDSEKKSFLDIEIESGVTSIGDYCFAYNDRLKTVVIPTCCISIGDYAFEGCTSLESVVIPNDCVSIGNCAFKNCSSLKSVVIPTGCVSIGYSAFAGCTSLVSIVIPESVVAIGDAKDFYGSSLDSGLFSGCSSLKNIVLPPNIQYIGSAMFANCESLEDIVIPNKVTDIREYAFFNCKNLVSIKLPKQDLLLGYCAFHGTKWLNENFPEEIIYIKNCLYACIPKGAKRNRFDLWANYLMIDGCVDIKELIVKEGTTQICDHAFDFCANLESIEIPKGIVYIGRSKRKFVVNVRDISSWVECDNNLFGIQGVRSGCDFYFNSEPIVDLVIPEGVRKIGNNFLGNDNIIRTVSIPNSVTNIERWAFKNSSLACVYGGNGIVNVERDAFCNTEWLDNQPDGCIYIGKCLYAYKGVMPDNFHLEVKEGTTQIYDNAFKGCNSLVSIKLPQSITSIGASAFYGCSSLKSIMLPCNIKRIEESVFEFCSSLTSMVIPSSVEELRRRAFGGCCALKSIFLPEALKIIGDSCFSGCSSLLSIVLPSGVEKIGEGAFRGCSSLGFANIGDSVKCIEESVFRGCSSLVSFVVPDPVEIIREKAFDNCDSLMLITMGKKVKVIEYKSFGCRSLQKINYNSNLVDWCKISRSKDGLHGNLFFRNEKCINEPYEIVENIEISKDIEYIADYAFYGIRSIKKVNFLDGADVYVGNDVFSCSSLEEVITPDFGRIGIHSFTDCSSLHNVILGKSLSYLPKFQGCCNSLTEIVLPEHIDFRISYFDNPNRVKPMTITVFSKEVPISDIPYYVEYGYKYIILKVPKELKAEYIEKFGKQVKSIEEI